MFFCSLFFKLLKKAVMITAFPTLAIEESASVPVSMSSVPNSERTVKSSTAQRSLVFKKQQLLQYYIEVSSRDHTQAPVGTFKPPIIPNS